MFLHSRPSYLATLHTLQLVQIHDSVPSSAAPLFRLLVTTAEAVVASVLVLLVVHVKRELTSTAKAMLPSSRFPGLGAPSFWKDRVEWSIW